LEYEYAISLGKLFFAVATTDAALEAKVKPMGSKVMKKSEPKKLEEFRKLVLSKIVSF
jgi:hypothetical protein